MHILENNNSGGTGPPRSAPFAAAGSGVPAEPRAAASAAAMASTDALLTWALGASLTPTPTEGRAEIERCVAPVCLFACLFVRLFVFTEQYITTLSSFRKESKN